MDLYRGSHVVDSFGNEGIVVKIIPGTDNENHGAVYVWQMNKLNYGADNCEHYSHFKWSDFLKILK